MRVRRAVPILAVSAVAIVVIGLGVQAASAGVLRFPGAGARQDGAAGHSESSYRELAEKLLTPPYPLPDGSDPSIKLYPGALPDEPKVELAIPADMRLVGSAVRSAGGPAGVEIVLESKLGREQARAALERGFLTDGWTAAAAGSNTGIGDPFNMQPPLLFCRSEAGPLAFVQILGRAGQPVDLRIQVQQLPAAARDHPCAAGASQPGPMDGPHKFGGGRLPMLRAPEGVGLEMMGGGGPPWRQTLEAEANTDRGVVDLEATFAEQLAAAGWNRQDGGAQGPIAWSTWSIPGDGGWRGFLLVSDSPVSGMRTVLVRAESPRRTF
jgi:hypothetical protein